MATAESLIEFQRKSFKDNSKKPDRDNDSEWDSPRHHKDSRRDETTKENEVKRDKPRVDRGKEKVGDSPRPLIKYFICDGPHRVFNCAKCNSLVALIKEMQEEEKEQGGVASIGLLSTIKTEKKDLLKGRIYVQAKVLGKKIKAMEDWG
ncbi:hypothetical protein MANES_17G001483v8 [Manihot esculenta]|uniref:Uncharacterized protein n=1 Tax=Manihot esculenta TaxID=3983 RepID=A0A2C9U3L9_MANES|nr:hypothetical protein MANES_17G001483v8 [Manihot esculenta]